MAQNSGMTVPTKRKLTTHNVAADQAGFVARLQRVLSHWPSADRLARATGVSPSAFRKWLKGEAEPSRDRLVALAGAAGVGVSWLAQGEGPEPDSAWLSQRAGGPALPASARLASQFVMLPKHAEAVAAGSGHPIPDQDAVEFIGFRVDWLHNTLGQTPENIKLETAIGESMEPQIHDGDLLVVDTNDRKFRNFGIYVLNVRDERLVKRVQRKFDGSLILISDNKVYVPEEIPADLATEVHVVGRVIWRGGKI
jgi:phage repressor protein C with HTH and peptisase S24 domain